MKFFLVLFNLLFSISLYASAMSTSSTTTNEQEIEMYGSQNFIDESHTQIQNTHISQGTISNSTYVDGDLDDSIDVDQTLIIDQPDEIIDVHVDAVKTRKYLTVDPRTLAQDLEEAFTQIIRSDAKAKVYAVVNGRSIDRIVDVKAMKHGSLVIIAYKSGRKLKHYAVKPEDVDEIGQR